MVVNSNNSLVIAKIDVFNGNLKDSVVRAVVRSFRKVEAGWMYLKVSFSTNVKDPDYNVELVNTVVDMKRLMNGVYANPILRSVYDKLQKNVDFELKYPFPPVRTSKIYASLKFI